MSLHVDDSWSEIIEYAYDGLSPKYREFLEKDEQYFPNFDNFLNAFKTLPLGKTKFILFGQDPYPRQKSAIGYAFIDGNVKDIFSEKGFSKEVNRATSLRNFLKMLLLSENYLTKNDLSQEAISKVEKKEFINSVNDLKNNFEQNGVLLLNTALVFTSKKDTSAHVKEFRPFINRLLSKLIYKNIELVFFGNIAKDIRKRFPITLEYKVFETLHPYNIGFIHDSLAQNYFKPMNLLKIKS